MANVDIASIARDMYQAFNSHDLNKAVSYAHDDAKTTVMGSGMELSVRDNLQNWMNGFSDAECEVTNVIVQGDTAVVEFIGRGTHDGPLESPMGRIEPTNRRGEMHMLEIHEFKDGKVASTRAYFDALALMQQLGVSAGAREPELVGAPS